MNHKHSIWRSDITGLRALAVIPVLIYHAWPQVMPGGFVGVDIFFFISGYLISGILFRELLQKGKIDYFNFYAKRIRRIIPNLLCVLTFTFVVGWFFLVDSEFKSLGKQIYSSILFCQNFRLLKELGDYFADSAARQPLLHLWSLAIEEQFYIVFPILCTLIWKFTRSIRLLGGMVVVIVLGSLIGCFSVKDPAARFYFPLTRFWELGAGILLAYAETMGHWSTERFSSISRHCISLLGGGLVICALFVADANAFPNLTALMPVAGAVLMIATSPNSLFNRLLAWKPLVFVGLISYSLYLWHWPLLAYWNIIEPLHAPSDNAVILALTLVVSTLSYRFVETPVRLCRGASSRKLVAALVVGMVLVFGLGQTARYLSVFEARLTDNLLLWQTIRSDWAYPKPFREQTYSDAITFTAGEDFPELWFVGDSHIEQYASRIKDLSDQTNQSVGFLTKTGCFAASGIVPKVESCNDVVQAFKKLIADPRIHTIVWGEKWGDYLHRGATIGFSYMTPEGSIQPLNHEGFVLTLQHTIRLIQQQNKRLFLLLDAPWDEESGQFHPTMLLSRLPWKKISPQDFIVDIPKAKSWRDGNEAVREAVQDASVVIIDPSNQVCPNQKCSLLNYKDDDHLRASYLRDHATWIDPVFQH